MISRKCFDQEWIDSKRSELRVRDPGLLEKCIHALQLLGHLSEMSGFDFVFKGGTSLVLLLEDIRRLSIDIDIVSSADQEVYMPMLEDIGNSYPFLRQEEDQRGDGRLPRRRHFKFFYNSTYSQREDYVLLDILEEENHFPETQLLPVRTPFVEVDREVMVRVPTIDCLTGDKLTAFAPGTVGVPLRIESSMQVAKQLFDVGELFNVIEDLEMVKRAYTDIFTAENGYRGNRFSLMDALDDTIDTSALICQLNLKGGIADDHTKLISNGISRIQNHLIGPPYRIDDAKVSAARVAYLAGLLKQDAIPSDIAGARFIRYKADELRDKQLEKRHVLNRLKAFNIEAFHYWLELENLDRQEK